MILPKWCDFGFFNYEKPSFLRAWFLRAWESFCAAVTLSIFHFWRHAPRGMAPRWPLSNTKPNPPIGKKRAQSGSRDAVKSCIRNQLKIDI